MMKATAWFCPVVLTLLCATRLVCTAQRGGGGNYANGYPLDYLDDAQAVQDDYLLAKRNKPSLSIVNPLDVLRQRLLLEIARRQMKENTRQVELNRAILKNVGKRRYQEQQQEREQQLQQQQQLQRLHFPSQLWSLPQFSSARFFDFLQHPQTQARQRATGGAGGGAAAAAQQKSLNVVAKHQSNGNEIANETNHENGNGKSATGTVNDLEDEQEQGDSTNWANQEPNDLTADADADTGTESRRLPWRFLFGLDKNQQQHYAN